LLLSGIFIDLVDLSGKVIPEDAVLEMKLNYSLPNESDEHVDEVVWIELSRENSEELVQT